MVHYYYLLLVLLAWYKERSIFNQNKYNCMAWHTKNPCWGWFRILFSLFNYRHKINQWRLDLSHIIANLFLVSIGSPKLKIYSCQNWVSNFLMESEEEVSVNTNKFNGSKTHIKCLFLLFQDYLLCSFAKLRGGMKRRGLLWSNWQCRYWKQHWKQNYEQWFSESEPLLI